jgi:arylsulfatase A-like enzyme
VSRVLAGSEGRLAAAVWLAVGVGGSALDLAAARLSGYPLRLEHGVLLGAHVLAWALYGTAALAAVLVAARIARRPGVLARAPRTLALALIGAPLVARGFVGGLAGAGWLLAAVAVLGLGGTAYGERHRRWGHPRAGAVGLVLAAGVLVMALAAWPPLPGRSQLRGREGRDSGPAAASAPNVLLIVLDTVRADHIGLYGYDRPTTPFLDALAGRATVFEEAIAPSSWTLPSHASIFTGLHPQEHGADTLPIAPGTAVGGTGRAGSDAAPVAPLSEEAETLAEQVAQLGLHTGAICGNTSYLYHGFGLAQGFDTYVDELPTRIASRPAGLALARRFEGYIQPLRRALTANEVAYLRAGEVTRLALQYLQKRRDQRFFLFLNYMDAHFPFCPVGAYARLFPQAGAAPAIDFEAIRNRVRGARPYERASLRDRYDAELRLVDDQLARLFARLEAWGLLERTLVIIVGDHGEALGEHHDIYHNNGAYETVVHVPLLLRRPGQPAGTRIARFTPILDIYPTVLAELGLPVPPGQHGVHLLSDAPRDPLVTYTAPWPPLAAAHPRFYDRDHWGIYRDPYKLIERSDGSRELYDLRADPAELRDLSEELPAVMVELSDSLAAYRATLAPRFTRSEALVAPEVRERLRGLGYIR